MTGDVRAFPAIPFSHARFDGSSAHEARPGDHVSSAVYVESVVYQPDGSTLITQTGNHLLRVTGWGRRTHLALLPEVVA